MISTGIKRVNKMQIVVEKTMSEYVDYDRCISNKRCCLLDLAITPSAAGAGIVTLYDGFNNTGRIKLVLSSIASLSITHSFSHGLCFNNGLYVTLGTNITSVTAVFCCIEE